MVDISITRGDVYVACYYDGIIKVRGGNISIVANTTQCGNPKKIVVNSNTGVIYVGGSLSNQAGLIAINNGTVRKLASEGSSGCVTSEDLSVNGDTEDVYAACSNNSEGAVLKIDPQGNVTVSVNKLLCPHPQSVAVDSANITYVGCYSNVIAVKDGMVAILTDQCGWPVSLSIDKKLNVMYVACYLSSTVKSITLPPLFLPFVVPENGLSGGSIAGIVIGVVGGSVLLFLVIYCLVKRSRKSNTEKSGFVNF
jgi:DNA-binding beta-propeller fold protein YncE